MKNMVKRTIRGERGAALVLVLVLLLLSGLIIGPLLSYMGTGLSTGEVCEVRTDELYAADAGVEDALWKIQQGVVKLCPGDPDWPPYAITINDNTVQVKVSSIYGVGNVTTMYRVISTAVGDSTGTEVEAYVSGAMIYSDYSGLLDHIININENLTDKEIDDLIRELGKVTLACREECVSDCTDGCGAVYDYDAIPEGCYGCGAVYNYPDALWPTATLLAAWYSENVKNETPYPSDTIDLGGIDMALGPLYRDGGLSIYNSINTPATLCLNGTVYITGDTLIGTTNNDFILDLNGQTIFVASDSSDPQRALWIGGQCTIMGPGCIIAVGDIYFAPKGAVGANEEAVFIFSVSGTTQLQPSGDFYGAVAGNFDVEIKSGTTPTLTYPPGGFGDVFNFPGLTGSARVLYSIQSWEVTRLSPGA